MKTTRRSKIARLPKSIRDELNQRLVDGDPASEILDWLNHDSDVEEVLAKYFQCRPINKQNLHEWRRGGHQDWLSEQQTLDFASRLVERSGNLAEQSGHQCLPDHFATLLSTEFIKLAQTMLDENQDTKQRWACLGEIQDRLSRLRRDDHRAVWASVEHERWTRRTKAEDEAAAKAAHKEERRQHVVRYRILKAGLLDHETRLYGDSDIAHDVAAMSLEEQHDLEFGLLGRKSDLFALRRDPDEHIFPWRRTKEQRAAHTARANRAQTSATAPATPAASAPPDPSNPSHTPDSSNPPPPTPDAIPLANDLSPEASAAASPMGQQGRQPERLAISQPGVERIAFYPGYEPKNPTTLKVVASNAVYSPRHLPQPPTPSIQQRCPGLRKRKPGQD